MGEAKETILELVRREGLIVIAIVALGWQVYFLTSQSQEQDKLWREELAAYRVMFVDLDAKIGERWIKLTDRSSEINLRLASLDADMKLLLQKANINLSPIGVHDVGQ
jgi:hypothetical protein